jgi:hypothetical protein
MSILTLGARKTSYATQWPIIYNFKSKFTMSSGRVDNYSYRQVGRVHNTWDTFCSLHIVKQVCIAALAQQMPTVCQANYNDHSFSG